MNVERLSALLDRFPQVKILVVGDFFLDKYLMIQHDLAELSLETGQEAHQVAGVCCSPGAAGTITNNLRAMGAQVLALGVTGDDGEGYELRRGLAQTGVATTEMLVFGDRVTPTYTKPMLCEPDGSQHELNRLDIKNRVPLPGAIEDEVITRLAGLMSQVDGVIAVDQVSEANCGVITSRVRSALAELACAHPDVFIIAESRAYTGLFYDVMLKPNGREALEAMCPESGGEGDFDAACAAAADLYHRNGRPLFLTLGDRGILVFHTGGPTHVPAVPITGPIDIVGAGDATMAGLMAGLCAGATPVEAAEIGCLASGVTIRQIGTTGTASRGQILACHMEVVRA
jgi:rfaE bifunctional protein kinase chain/domain